MNNLFYLNKYIFVLILTRNFPLNIFVNIKIIFLNTILNIKMKNNIFIKIFFNF